MHTAHFIINLLNFFLTPQDLELKGIECLAFDKPDLDCKPTGSDSVKIEHESADLPNKKLKLQPSLQDHNYYGELNKVDLLHLLQRSYR